MAGIFRRVVDKTFYVKGQTVTILGFVVHMVSMTIDSTLPL